MQVKSLPATVPRQNSGYGAGMPRKLSKPRPRQGAHLVELRKAAGLSQVELAELVGEKQQNIAFWEQSNKPPRSDVLPKLARVLGVRVEDLLHPDTSPKRRGGPVGKVLRIFEEVSKLPRREQSRVVEFVATMLEHYKRSAG